MAIVVSRSFRSILGVLVVVLVSAIQVGRAQQPPGRLGGTYSDLDARRQQLVDNWVARFVKVTGQPVEAGPSMTMSSACRRKRRSMPLPMPSWPRF